MRLINFSFIIYPSHPLCKPPLRFRSLTKLRNTPKLPSLLPLPLPKPAHPSLSTTLIRFVSLPKTPNIIIFLKAFLLWSILFSTQPKLSKINHQHTPCNQRQRTLFIQSNFKNPITSTLNLDLPLWTSRPYLRLRLLEY